MNLTEAIEKIDSLKKEIDALRPLDRETESRIMQKFRLDWNYHSNALEGNPYNYGETVALIMEGITAHGKSLKDHLDIKGHNDAINFLLSIVKEERGFSEADIRALHKMILVQPYYVDAVTPDGKATKKLITLGEYKTTPNNVITPTGETHYYDTPEETRIRMPELVEWYQKAVDSIHKKDVHPLIIAAMFHHKFVATHPFDDGNGRMGRLLMNLILMRNDFPPIVIKKEDKLNYFAKLVEADAGNIKPFTDYLAQLLIHSLEIYLKGAKGESIEESTDIDKEISLFKAQFKNEDRARIRRNKEVIQQVISNSLLPLYIYLQAQFKKLNELFLSAKDILQFSDDGTVYRTLQTQDLTTLEQNWLKGRVYSSMERPLEKFNYHYEWKGFKKSDNPFDIYSEVIIEFSDYQYIIRSWRKEKPFFKKFYHEQLTEEEIQTITKEMVNDVLNDIKNRTMQKE